MINQAQYDQAIEAAENADSPEKRSAARDAATTLLRQDYEHVRGKLEGYFPKDLPSREHRISAAYQHLDRAYFDVDVNGAVNKLKSERPGVMPRKRVTPDTSRVGNFLAGKTKTTYY